MMMMMMMMMVMTVMNDFSVYMIMNTSNKGDDGYDNDVFDTCSHKTTLTTSMLYKENKIEHESNRE